MLPSRLFRCLNSYHGKSYRGLVLPTTRSFSRTMTSRFIVTPRENGLYKDVLEVQGSPLSIRRAVPSDHDAILAMDASGGAYDDGDYLHSVLGGYLRDPSRTAYIAEWKGKVVSFLLMRSADAGYNVVGRLARVDRQVRDSGIWDAMRYISAVDTCHLQPQVRMYFGCTSSFTSVPYFKQQNWRQVLSRPYVSMTLDKEQVVRTPQLEVKCNEISKSECETILQDPSQSSKLFPSGMAVIGREPFLVHPVNFEAMRKEADAILVSQSSDTSSSNVTGVSFGSGSVGHNNVFIYDCAIYTISGDPLELAQHVYANIPRAQRLCTEQKIMLYVFAQFPQESEALMDSVCQLKMADGNNFVKDATKISFHSLISLPFKKNLEASRDTFIEMKTNKMSAL